MIGNRLSERPFWISHYFPTLLERKPSCGFLVVKIQIKKRAFNYLRKRVLTAFQVNDVVSAVVIQSLKKKTLAIRLEPRAGKWMTIASDFRGSRQANANGGKAKPDVAELCDHSRLNQIPETQQGLILIKTILRNPERGLLHSGTMMIV